MTAPKRDPFAVLGDDWRVSFRARGRSPATISSYRTVGDCFGAYVCREAGLRLAGWRSREMAGRYAPSAADERSRDAHRRLARGDRL